MNKLTTLFLLILAGHSVCRAQDTVADPVRYQIKPSDTDPAIRNFDDPHYIFIGANAGPDAELAVFMPGTDGKPSNAVKLLKVIAAQGYRVIGLEYNDFPAVVEICPRDPSPSCSGDFRRERVFGDARAPVQNSPAESIVNRLTKLLIYLDREHPDAGWGSYLAGDEPNWSRIVVSGLSQGAGMAAYIAKKESVARVVLFSSPWDYSRGTGKLAPWIGESSATPPQRWFAEYHKRENTAQLIARAYAVLQIPAANVRVFNLDIPADVPVGGSKNPFHVSTIRVPGYEPEWRFLYGQSP